VLSESSGIVQRQGKAQTSATLLLPALHDSNVLERFSDRRFYTANIKSPIRYEISYQKNAPKHLSHVVPEEVK